MPSLIASIRWIVIVTLLTISSSAGQIAWVDQPSTNAPNRYRLRATETWRLNTPGNIRIDASGLLLLPDGKLLTVNDKDGSVYSIDRTGPQPEANLVLETNLFSPRALQTFAARKHGHYDGEGLARDSRGRIYLCEEADRWILRCDPANGAVELLEIDWSPVRRWFSSDPNASFEGIAIHGDQLYVANERQTGRIIVVDLPSRKVIDDFQVLPLGVTAADVHYSDLSWYDDSLWVLCRESRCVLKIDIKSHATLAQFDFGDIEKSFQNAYAHPFPYGFVEGLAVDAQWIWLVVDNNGFPRLASLSDRRPTLWRCRRPDTEH